MEDINSECAVQQPAIASLGLTSLKKLFCMHPSHVNVNPYTHLWNVWKWPFLGANHWITHLIWYHISCVTTNTKRRLVSHLSVHQKLGGCKQEKSHPVLMISQTGTNYRQTRKPTFDSRNTPDLVEKESPIRFLRTYPFSRRNKEKKWIPLS